MTGIGDQTAGKLPMTELAEKFRLLPEGYQQVLRLAQERHQIQVMPLQELSGGRTEARLYLVSVPSDSGGQLRHYILKIDKKNSKSARDESERHRLQGYTFAIVLLVVTAIGGVLQGVFSTESLYGEIFSPII